MEASQSDRPGTSRETYTDASTPPASSSILPYERRSRSPEHRLLRRNIIMLLPSPHFPLAPSSVRRRTKSEQRRNRGSQRTREILPPLSPDKQVRKRGVHEKMETWLETRLILVSMGQAFRVIGELNSSPACTSLLSQNSLCSFRQTPRIRCTHTRTRIHYSSIRNRRNKYLKNVSIDRGNATLSSEENENTEFTDRYLVLTARE